MLTCMTLHYNFQKKYYIPIDDDNIMNMDTRNKIIIVNPMLGILE